MGALSRPLTGNKPLVTDVPVERDQFHGMRFGNAEGETWVFVEPAGSRQSLVELGGSLEWGFSCRDSLRLAARMLRHAIGTQPECEVPWLVEFRERFVLRLDRYEWTLAVETVQAWVETMDRTVEPLVIPRIRF